MTTSTPTGGLLAGVRIIESALLGPGGVAMHLADLGAEVIKVEGRAATTSGRWRSRSSTASRSSTGT
jgi:crotonobetainyl-CoA:carnitine CoA-transferase CaiB-like acyl-CoA transferase